MTRVERLARHGPPALVIALGIAGILSPEPWSLRAAMAQMVVVTLLIAPVASKAVVELILGPLEVRDLRDATARAHAVERELNDAIAGYLGWRVRILGVLRGYRDGYGEGTRAARDANTAACERYGHRPTMGQTTRARISGA